MDVETVCTEADLGDYLGDQLTAQSRILPSTWTDASKARQQALDEVLTALSRRTPPIREADLATPTELKRAVQYGAEMWLLWHSLTTAGQDSVLAFKYSEARKRFSAEVNGLTPTVSGGLRGSSFGFGISRR